MGARPGALWPKARLQLGVLRQRVPHARELLRRVPGPGRQEHHRPVHLAVESAV